jgi:hypothetical protein
VETPAIGIDRLSLAPKSLQEYKLSGAGRQRRCGRDAGIGRHVLCELSRADFGLLSDYLARVKQIKVKGGANFSVSIWPHFYDGDTLEARKLFS